MSAKPFAFGDPVEVVEDDAAPFRVYRRWRKGERATFLRTAPGPDGPWAVCYWPAARSEWAVPARVLAHRVSPEPTLYAVQDGTVTRVPTHTSRFSRGAALDGEELAFECAARGIARTYWLATPAGTAFVYSPIRARGVSYGD